MLGLDRTRAAEWATRATGYAVSEATLRHWERRALLRPQQPGHRVPCLYRLDDLVRLSALAILRRDGASLQRITRAMRSLRHFLPEIEPHPGAWRLAVVASGDVVRIENDRQALELTRQPGQIAFLDAGALKAEAQAAIEEHAARASA